MNKVRKIRDLLASKHSRDIFVSECKTNSTWSSSGFQQLDAWAMMKSWKRPYMYGYEIKVSRSDFVNDDKWPGYLDFCNFFYFVAPHNVIQIEELPKDCGLLVPSKKLTMLFTKKKAPRREIEFPIGICRYILMWRAKIVDERATEDETEYWREWLAQKGEKQKLGHKVSRRIRQIVKNDIEEVRSENRILQSRIKMLEKVENIIADVGFSSTDFRWDLDRKFEAKLRELETGIPGGLDKYCKNAILELENIVKLIEQTKNKPKQLQLIDGK